MSFGMRNSNTPYAFRDTLQRQQASLWAQNDLEPRRSIALPTIQFANDFDDPSSNVSDFVRRLYRMLEDKLYPGIVAWSQGGDSFVIRDITDFTRTVLPRLFKHSNFASFVRQLNKYSFHKVKSPNLSDPVVSDQSWVFTHEHFQSKNLAGLEHIKRKVPPPRKSSTTTSAHSEDAKAPSAPAVVPVSDARSSTPQDRFDALSKSHDDLAVTVRQLDTGYQALLTEVMALQRTLMDQANIIQQMVQQIVSTGNGDFSGLQAQLDNANLAHPLSLSLLNSLTTEPSTPESINDSPTLSPTMNLEADASLSSIFDSPLDLPLVTETSTQPPNNPDTQPPDVLDLFPTVPRITQPLALRKTKGETVQPARSSGQASHSDRASPHLPHWAIAPRVLLVDDDSVCVLLSSKFLKTLGCSIDVAIDGLSAVDKMNASKYDLVLMDISMPNLDGVSATTIIRQFDILTPIISMTGSASPADVLNYYSHGMTDVLSKPFTRDRLVSILEKHLTHLTSIVIPRNPGIPPLADSPFSDAISAGLTAAPSDLEKSLPNPLAGMGVSDLQYEDMVRELLSSASNSPRKRALEVSDDRPTKKGRFETID